jgi:hypothetical protein
MQADKRSCGSMRGEGLAVAGEITVKAGSSALTVCAKDASTPQKDQFVKT